jgi:quercetin dioxygenase-like cupin family protein
MATLFKKLIPGFALMAMLCANTAAQMNSASNPANPTDRVSEVHYYHQEEVAVSFAKAGTLLHGSNYVVMTASRNKPGEVEIHTRYTDVFYVVDGTATIQVDGTMVGVKPGTDPDEPRGASMEGGETHELSQGDVIVIPAGVPHWINKVPGTFHYFVVKIETASK